MPTIDIPEIHIPDIEIPPVYIPRVFLPGYEPLNVEIIGCKYFNHAYNFTFN